jgi:hypothetical protein
MMSHYAKIDEFNIVQEVIVAEYDQILSGAFGDPNTWIRTSRNTIMGQHISGGKPFRKNYAGAGYTWDPVRDAFIPPKPWASWVLNEETCHWEPPVPIPDEPGDWEWWEPTQSWITTDQAVELQSSWMGDE